MNALDLLRDPVWQRLAMALLHFVWQGAVIALVLGGSMWLLRVRRPQVRYAVWLGGLVLMAACPTATFVVTEPAIAVVTLSNSATGDATTPLWPETAGERQAASPPLDVTTGLREQVAQVVEERDRLVALIAPYLVLFWFAGVGVFGGRLLLGVRRSTLAGVGAASSGGGTCRAGRPAGAANRSAAGAARGDLYAGARGTGGRVLAAADPAPRGMAGRAAAGGASGGARPRAGPHPPPGRVGEPGAAGHRGAAVLSPGGVVGLAARAGRARAVLRRSGGEGDGETSRVRAGAGVRCSAPAG